MRRLKLPASLLALLLGSVLIVPALGFAAEEPSTVSGEHWTSERWVGFHVPGASTDAARLTQLEAETGIHAAVVNYFQNGEHDFSAAQATAVSQCGAIPMVTLEMWKPTGSASQPAYSLAAINSGKFDAYFTRFARDAAAYGKPVWLRPFHEMNGNWYPWCGTVNGNSPAAFVTAWRRVHGIFRQQGATNVEFVWCPNVDSIDAQGRVNTSANAIKQYWPGGDYVDYMALDGYNFGEGDGQSWRSFTQIFARPYAEVIALSATKPLFIAETGCATQGGSKPAWIADMFATSSRNFPRIRGIGWFNANKDRDWRVNSSPISLEAFRGGVSGGEWAVAQRIGVWKARTTLIASAGRSLGSVGRPLTVRMAMTPRGSHDRVRVEVLPPGSTRWTVVAVGLQRPEATAWVCRYTPQSTGAYRFRVRFDGDAMRQRATAVTASVTVR